MMFQQLPWLLTLGILIALSAFFSASEAALFFLSPQELRTMRVGNRAQQLAAGLLKSPDRLLTAVLFWNLMVNVAYFALASILSIQLQHDGHSAAAAGLSAGALLAIILLGETVPKSIAVLQPRWLATLVAVPLSVAVRAADPALPLFRLIVLLTKRAIWPRFEPEPYLEVADLERAVELSTTDAVLLEQEKTALQNILSLSETRVDELMRPRMRTRAFRPPISLRELEGRVPAGGYVLVTEPHSDEVAAAIAIANAASLPREHLEYYAEEVVYVPWCATAADTLEMLRGRDRSVAAVVNELGESIGIITLDDILDTVFRPGASRSQRLLKQSPIQADADGGWRVTGMTTLRRLARQFDVTLPPTRVVTVAGVIQEVLKRLPVPGDRCRWGPFGFEVLGVPEHGQVMVRMTFTPQNEARTP